MIIEKILDLFLGLLKVVFDLLPDIPSLPDSLLNSLNNVFDTIFNNIGLLGLFVRIDTIKILVPLIIVTINFEHIYHFILWILKKIPMAGME